MDTEDDIYNTGSGEDLEEDEVISTDGDRTSDAVEDEAAVEAAIEEVEEVEEADEDEEAEEAEEADEDDEVEQEHEDGVPAVRVPVENSGTDDEESEDDWDEDVGCTLACKEAIQSFIARIRQKRAENRNLDAEIVGLKARVAELEALRPATRGARHPRRKASHQIPSQRGPQANLA